MIKIFLKYKLFDLCIDVFFSALHNNFHKPIHTRYPSLYSLKINKLLNETIERMKGFKESSKMKSTAKKLGFDFDNFINNTEKLKDKVEEMDKEDFFD